MIELSYLIGGLMAGFGFGMLLGVALGMVWAVWVLRGAYKEAAQMRSDYKKALDILRYRNNFQRVERKQGGDHG